MTGHGRNSYIAGKETSSICSVDWSSDLSVSDHKSVDPLYGSSQGYSETSLRQEEIHISVAEHEKKWVNRLKILLIVVLLAAVIGTSFRIYVLLSNEEEEDFKIQFENYADQIIAVSQSNTLSSLETIGSFAIAISSYASSSNKTWPFVTVPNFAARAEKIAQQAHASRFAFAPVVEPEQLDSWNSFSISPDRARSYREDAEYLGLPNTTIPSGGWNISSIFSLNFTNPLVPVPDVYNIGSGPWGPYWQGYPIQNHGLKNYDIISGVRTGPAFFVANATNQRTLNFLVDLVFDENGDLAYSAQSVVVQPIFDEVMGTSEAKDEGTKMVGFLWIIIDWVYYFENLLPPSADGIIVVLKTSCGDAITYRINGLNAVQLGNPLEGDGDVHDPRYNHMERNATFFQPDLNQEKLLDGVCVPKLSLHVYPSSDFENIFLSNEPLHYALGVVLIFAFTALVFIVYDLMVRRHQRKVMDRVYLQERIVGDMFPTAIRQRLYGTEQDLNDNMGPEEQESNDNQDTGEIAELYPSVSIVFADISGFTAWSSAREPHQVFTLLETIYGKFDRIAKRNSVFKVETVGDCYVGAAGLPEECSDHVIKVAKFARDILAEMDGLTRQLEVKLGPDTTELKLRIGIHSGQVTAGVLRGERSRFQLFGDAVNMASRMESSSIRNQIQVSESTASLLRNSGKGHWLKPREESVTIKGKGRVRTFWLRPKRYSKSHCSHRISKNFEMNSIDEIDLCNSEFGEESCSEDEASVINDSTLFSLDKDTTKLERLVQWNTEVLAELLEQILSARSSQPQGNSDYLSLQKLEGQIGSVGTVLDEFVPIISLPQSKEKELQNGKSTEKVSLSKAAKKQLHRYVAAIANVYNDKPFHNFEHASHVTASVRKLLTRITNVDSYGISNDPLTQFSVVFSAVIHDADHPGVPNATLVKEQTRSSVIYDQKSIAEQNSVDLAWGILMESDFADLRACIYSNEDELKRFRQTVVNAVMATDICDKELGRQRKERWATAFSDENMDSTLDEAVNRKATIVIEHLIQASDVAHTMQHWQIFKKWNQRLFFEMYEAYKAGRAEKDPCEFWYQGEINFFDFYVIPLAKKLSSCGVFGVSSHEYLSYAEANREEWVQRGRDIVGEYVALIDCTECTTEESESTEGDVVADAV